MWTLILYNFLTFIRNLIMSFGMPVLLNLVIDCSYMIPHIIAMIVISGLTFQPCCFRASICGSYFLMLW